MFDVLCHADGVEEVQLAELGARLSDLDEVGNFPRRSGSPTSTIGPWPKLPIQPFRHIIPWGPITGQPAPHAQNRHVQDSVFATMSRPEPQTQPRASPLIPRSVPAPTPRTKSFSLPNALSRVGTPVAKGTWILGRGVDSPEDNGYVRSMNQAPCAWDAAPEAEPPS